MNPVKVLNGKNNFWFNYQAETRFLMARFRSSVALALLGVADEVDDGDARHEVLLVPTVKPFSRILARFGFVLRRTVAHLDAGSRPQRDRLCFGVGRSGKDLNKNDIM